MEKRNFKKEFKSLYDLGKVYYKILFELNGLNLKEKEAEILSFLNEYGTISSVTLRNKFLEMSNTSPMTLNKYISVLYRQGLLNKINGKVLLTDKLKFKDTILVNLLLSIEEKNTENVPA